MSDEWDEGRGKERTLLRHRDTLRMLRAYLRPVEPDPRFSRSLEELCESMGAREVFRSEGDAREEGGHRGLVIGGAIFSALPFLGVAAYAIRKHLLRRRVLPVGA